MLNGGNQGYGSISEVQEKIIVIPGRNTLAK
jgi:hypothetical protein